MELIFLTFKILSVLIGIYLVISAAYIFIHAIAGHFFKPKNVNEAYAYPKAVVLIPAYKEDAVIFGVAMRALQQDYPGDFDVVVIADQLKEETMDQLSTLPLKLVEVNFEKSTKSKALNFAMDQLDDEYEFSVILDADNIMQKGSLKRFADYIMAGETVVQGRRTASNLETDFSFLDSLSEEMNNHIYNAGSNALNYSSRIVGSGVAFQYQLFKRVMKEIDVVGGFDKALELKLIQSKHKITYAPDVVTYDEKVDDAEVFGRQRSRWLSAQYQFFFENVIQGMVQLLRGNGDYVAKLFQYILPPRLLFPMISFVGAAVVLSVYPAGGMIWMAAFLLVFFGYILSIPRRLYSKKMFESGGAIFTAAFQTVKALLNMNSAAKTFVHTPHKGSEISSYDK